MAGQALLPDPTSLHLLHIETERSVITMVVRTTACEAKCSLCEKSSSTAQLLEGKANLLRMQQEIPLTEEERAAVEDGVEAYERLLRKLEGVPTPAEASSSEVKVRGRSLPVLPTRTHNKPV